MTSANAWKIVVVSTGCGLGFLYAALTSIRSGTVQFRWGYQLRRVADPLGYWGAVASFVIIAGVAFWAGVGVIL